MHRFFLPELPGPHFHISHPDLIHQIRRVFRSKVGESFIFFSVGTPDFVYEITDISDTKIGFLQKEMRPSRSTSSLDLTVFQAYPHKYDTLELVVQKLVELGVQKLVLFHSERSQKDDIPIQKKLRIKKIAQEALEQCGGNIPIDIVYAQGDMSDIFGEYRNMSHIVGHPHDDAGIITPDFSTKNIGFWVGPEGGWTNLEEAFFQKNLFVLWKISEQILRLETASIVGSAILLYLAR